jgi:hypothetical protein
MKTKKQFFLSLSIILIFFITCLVTFEIKAESGGPLCQNCYSYLPDSGYIVTYGSAPCYCGEIFMGYYQNCACVQDYPSCGTFLHCEPPCDIKIINP